MVVIVLSDTVMLSPLQYPQITLNTGGTLSGTCNKYTYFGRDYGRGLARIKTLINIAHSNHGNTRGIGGSEGGL